MGSGDACPVFPGKHYEDSKVIGPAGQPIEVVRRARDEICERVQTLPADPAPDASCHLASSRDVRPIKFLNARGRGTTRNANRRPAAPHGMVVLRWCSDVPDRIGTAGMNSSPTSTSAFDSAVPQ